MLDKKRGYAYYRPFYDVDTNVQIQAGMVAFLASSNGVTVATTAASGTVPIGTFWKDQSLGYIRSTVESKTFSSSNGINLSKGNVVSTATIKVTNSAGTTVYTQGVDYSVATTNGVLTRIGAGSIPALATVVIWYQYTVSSTQVYWDNVSTKFSSGYNYDRQPDDTLGSGKITVAESDAKIYTDQYDVAQTYTINAALRSDSSSWWTTATTAYSVCGRVIKVPTAGDPFLGVQQIMVAV
jgi:phosphosulfolactate phosphohydrolase-like enzyme